MEQEETRGAYAPLEQYQYELGRNAELQERLESVSSERMTHLAQAALSASERRLDEQLHSPELIDAHAELCHEIGSRILSSEEWRELDGIASISQDLIAEEIDQERYAIDETVTQNLLEDKDGISSAILSEIYARHNHDSMQSHRSEKTVETDDTAQEQTISESSETQHSHEDTADKPTVQIAIDYEKQKALVGKDRRWIREYPLSKEKDSSIALDRARLLVTLAEHEDEELTITELWTKTFGDREFDQRKMQTYRRWLAKFRHNSKPIVVHNSKRGVTSGYSIPHHSLQLVHKNTQPDDESIRVAKEEASQNNTGEDGQADSNFVNELLDRTVADDSETANESEIVHYGQLYSLARTIVYRTKFLESVGVKPIDRKVLDQFELYAKENDIPIDLDMEAIADITDDSPEDIDSLTLCRLIALSDISTRDELLERVDVDNASDPLVTLLEYTTSLSDEDHETLEKIVSAEIVTEEKHAMTGGLSHRRHEVVDSRCVLKLRDGTIIYAQEEAQDSELDAYTVESTHTSAEVSSSTDLDLPLQTEKTTSLTTEVPKAEHVTDAPDEKHEAEQPSWEDDLTGDVQNAIKDFAEQGLLESETVSWNILKMKSTSAKIGTEEFARKGQASKILKKREAARIGDLPVYKAICLTLQDSYKDIFGSNTMRKRAMQIAEDEVKKYFEKKSKHKQQ